MILILSPGNHHLWVVILKICLSEHFIHKFPAFFGYWWWSNLPDSWADPSQRASDNHVTIASPTYGDLIIQKSQSLKCLASTLVLNFSQEFNTLPHSCFLIKLSPTFTFSHFLFVQSSPGTDLKRCFSQLFWRPWRHFYRFYSLHHLFWSVISLGL